MTSLKLKAAEWLAENPPGADSLTQCRKQFKLRAKHVGEVCRKAAAIRSQSYGEKLIDAAKAQAGSQ